MNKPIIALASIGLFVLISSSATSSQTPTKSSVIVECGTPDSIGKGVCRALRDEIARSPRYIEVPKTDENMRKSVRISLVTVDAVGTQEDDSLAAMSVAYVLNVTLLTHHVETCGRTRITDCATGIVDDLDNTLRAFRNVYNFK